MKAICDKCKQPFDSESIKLKERQCGNGITEIYYNCPNCDVEYIICKTSKQTRAIQKQIDELRNNIRDRLSNGIDVALQQKKIISLQKKHKKAMDKLNGRA